MLCLNNTQPYCVKANHLTCRVFIVSIQTTCDHSLYELITNYVYVPNMYMNKQLISAS